MLFLINAKYDNIKESARSFPYMCQQIEFDAPHFGLQLPVHIVSLIALVLCFSRTFHDVIAFHTKQGKCLQISLQYLYFTQSY